MRVLVITLTVAALALRLYRLRFGYAHGVLDDDSGVYLGSSLELVTGTLPYRDFVFVQPPVITLLFTPLALLAHVIGTAQAMGLAKITTGLAGAASVALVGVLVRGRGRAAVVLACGLCAVQGDAVASSYTLLLEPWLVLFCLTGLVLAFPGGVELATGPRLRWAGVALGVACATKIWAVAPVLALVVVLWPQRRRVATFLTGALLGFAVPVLPFLLAAPGAFVHQVFVVQLFRSADKRTSWVLRLVHVVSTAAPTGDRPTVPAWLLLAGPLVVVVVVGYGWRARGRAHPPFERFVGVAVVLTLLLLFVPDTFYWHYAAFSTPFLALAAVVPLARLRGGARGPLVVGLAGVIAAFTFALAARDLRDYRIIDDHRALDAAVAPGTCLVSTSATAAIVADRFTTADPGCPVLVDSFGTVLSLTDGRSPSPAALRNPAIEAEWLHLVQRARFVYVERGGSPRIPRDPALLRYVREHFHRVPIGPAAILLERD